MIKCNEELSKVFARQMFGTSNLNDKSITYKYEVVRSEKEKYALVEYRKQMYLLCEMGNRYDGFKLTAIEVAQLHNDNDIVSMYNNILFFATK